MATQSDVATSDTAANGLTLAALTRSRRLTPMLQQYIEAKKSCPNHALLLFRMGDFYEAFCEDAVALSSALNLQLTARDKQEEFPIPMAGVPHHALDGYLRRLVEKNVVVAICDQIETSRPGQKLLRRAITRIVTPGTLSELAALDPQVANFCGVVVGDTAQPYSLVLLDILAGDILMMPLNAAMLVDELQRFGVREVVVTSSQRPHLSNLLTQPDMRWRISELPPDSAMPDAADWPAFLENYGGVPAELSQLEAPVANSLLQALVLAIRYGQSAHRQETLFCKSPQLLQPASYLTLDAATCSHLELFCNQKDHKSHGSLAWHLDVCRTSMGSRLIRQWLQLPLRQLEPLHKRLDTVAQLVEKRSLRLELRQILQKVGDLERLTGCVALHRANPADLAALRTALQQLPKLRLLLQGQIVHLGKLWQGVGLLEDLAEELQRALVESPPRQLSDGAPVFCPSYCPELDAVVELTSDQTTFLKNLEAKERARSQIASLKVRYNRVFGYYLEIPRSSLHAVPKHYVRRQTLANHERYVTEELAQLESQVLAAEAQKAQLLSDCFADLLAKVRENIYALRRLSRLLARTDVLAALAEVADVQRYCRPSLDESTDLQLQASRHPVIERLLPQQETFVPNDVQMSGQTQGLLLLTGPNMGGKSTYMRQIALSVIMAQIGSFVPANRARIGLCDRVMTRVGASDFIGLGQSTFMVEMLETAHILRHATPRSLVLLDELGRGTSTFDGISLAWAVLEFLVGLRCRTLFATHYFELTKLAEQHDFVKNMHVAVHHFNEKIVFLRQILPGSTAKSFGIDVAKLAGLPKSVITRAKAVLTELENVQGGFHPNSVSNPPPAQPIMPSSVADLLAVLHKTDPMQLSPMQALQHLCAVKELAEICAAEG